MTTKKYTVITGASSGIGKQTARAFARRNKNLLLIARREGQLLQLKQVIQAENPQIDVQLYPTDLSVIQSIEPLFEKLSVYEIETWINNAGFGMYGELATNDIEMIEAMLHLNIEALTLLSTLFAKKYRNTPGTQLINVSSAGGYTIVPTAIVYCATKFFVSAFTEGLADELKTTGAKMQAKVLAPAATKTEFGKVANQAESYDYDQAFGTYHTSQEMAQFLLQLYDSQQTVGYINRDSFTFELSQGRLPSAASSTNNQKLK
ncbi:SDR family NAD(P)-dependent oxidoreductase [Enterococcus sp. AZ163]|uniref:SDR family NAD(P)-dependent oxidoreductase n=1 Tax=Enterococcus sp. AZ163 TaxID=2774638 RepID=UPI003D2C4E33